jgi:hypothetical protein
VKFRSALGGRFVDVMGGWDRPLQEFFLTVFDLECAEDADTDVIWSNIDDPSEADRRGTDRLRAKLKAFGITPPTDFWEQVERREGNITHVYTDDGGWTSY